jgi:hypothetical protein
MKPHARSGAQSRDDLETNSTLVKTTRIEPVSAFDGVVRAIDAASPIQAAGINRVRYFLMTESDWQFLYSARIIARYPNTAAQSRRRMSVSPGTYRFNPS